MDHENFRSKVTVKGGLDPRRLARSTKIETMRLSNIYYLLLILRYSGSDYAEIILEMTTR